jgi:hypothetical protein
MPNITASVGNGGVNSAADVKIVQALLNRHAAKIGFAPLSVDGKIGAGTVAAIRLFQTKSFGIDSPNGRADPGGRTITAMNALPAPASLSGAAWWHANQARFSNSLLISDLHPDFRDKTARFINALRAAGALVTVASTRRNAIRAYLMHYCWRLSRTDIDPASIPDNPGCGIQWDHGNRVKSRNAARAMSDLFALKFEPSLTSRHIEGKAIDMKILWTGKINVKDAHGNRIEVYTPNDCAQNRILHGIGASYGVIKLFSDPPHWSSDGR